MSASSSPASAVHLWRRPGLLYVLMLLAGLAAGLWPEAIYRPHVADASPVLPALPCLAVAQVAYLLGAHPLVLWSRRQSKRFSWLFTVCESALLVVLAGPLLLMAAYVSDAGWADVLRTELALVLLMPLAWAAGAGAASPAARSLVSLTILIVTAGLAATWYIVSEFVPSADAGVPWQLGAFTYAWDNAAHRGAWYPQPAWPVLAYLAAGLAWLAAIALRSRLPRVPLA